MTIAKGLKLARTSRVARRAGAKSLLASYHPGVDALTRSGRLVIVATLLAASLVGCARQPVGPMSSAPDQAPGDSVTTAPASPAPGSNSGVGSGGGLPGGLPTPPKPPVTASDQLPTDVVVGTVMAASSGPCYHIETDDGIAYALYGSGGTVERGQRIRVKVVPLVLAIKCGTGIHMRIVTFDVSA